MCERKVRPPVTGERPSMTGPSQAWRDAATQGSADMQRHDQLARESACFSGFRQIQPETEAPFGTELKVAAWNLERCKHVEGSASVLKNFNADIALVTEMDLGMARAENRDTTADLAAHLGMGHIYGVEFIELGLGDDREIEQHQSETNDQGLHGNAVLTKFKIDKAVILPLDEGGKWFSDELGGDQRRIGGRMAVAVRHLLPSPIWFVSVHYESRLGPIERAEETRALLTQIDRVCGSEPVLIGGDFNCKGLQENGLLGREALEKADFAEPMFATYAEAGFDWKSANTGDITTRLHAWAPEDHKPVKNIDWFFVRGVRCSTPIVMPAVSEGGVNLSDHEMIGLTLHLPVSKD